MTLRDNAMAVLRYENYEKLPVIHFGFWDETLAKWDNVRYYCDRMGKEFKGS